jgi:hypothetical protein
VERINVLRSAALPGPPNNLSLCHVRILSKVEFEFYPRIQIYAKINCSLDMQITAEDEGRNK